MSKLFDRHFTTRRVVLVGIVAALYAVLTIVLAPISYGPIQFRVSEALKVIVLFDPFLALGIGIGTFFANLASPIVGPWELIAMPLTDMIGGLIAWSIYHVLGTSKYWKMVVSMIAYSITTGLSVGTMLTAYGLGGFWVMAASVTASELVILIVGGSILYAPLNVLKHRGTFGDVPA